MIKYMQVQVMKYMQIHGVWLW